LGMLHNSFVVEHMTVRTTVLGQTISTRANITSNLRLLSVEDK